VHEEPGAQLRLESSRFVPHPVHPFAQGPKGLILLEPEGPRVRIRRTTSHPTCATDADGRHDASGSRIWVHPAAMLVKVIPTTSARVTLRVKLLIPCPPSGSFPADGMFVPLLA
jgi:hypothetical protein